VLTYNQPISCKRHYTVLYVKYLTLKQPIHLVMLTLYSLRTW